MAKHLAHRFKEPGFLAARFGRAGEIRLIPM